MSERGHHGELPSSLEGPLLRSLLGASVVAWALVEVDGQVVEFGGAWLEFFGVEPTRRARLVDTLELFEGLFPVTGEVETLERLALGDERFVDAHLGPLDDGGAFVLLRDVSERAHSETRLVRRANDLSLLRRAIGGELEAPGGSLRQRLGRLFEKGVDSEQPLWTACVRLDLALSPEDRQHWSRWIEEWLLERSAIIQRRGNGCFLALFGLLPEESSPSRSALDSLLELRTALERFGQHLVTFSLCFGETQVRLVAGNRLVWDGAPVARAWRLAREASPRQIRIGKQAIGESVHLASQTTSIPGAEPSWLYVEDARDGADPGSVLAGLGYLVLRPEEDSRFRFEYPLPGWFDAVDREVVADSTLLLEDAFPFLEVFLEEASEVWETEGLALRYSGVWSQDDRYGDELDFEAAALSTTSGGRFLLVQNIGRRVEVHRTLLEHFHSSRLDLERQRKRLDRREVLLHCIVHDLRGPLNNVVASITALEGSLAKTADEFQREMLELGRSESKRQDEMIRSLLEVFKAEVEALEGFETDAASAPRAFAAVRDVGESFRQGFEQAGIRLVVALDPRLEGGDVPVHGRLDRLERVLANLLENARRHAPSGSEVRLAASVTGGGVEFEVVDQGPGVPAALSGLLFNRFQRGTIGGAAGLGLFFCRTTVERWGGRIGHEAGDDGVGARFWFWLPQAE